MRLADVVAVLDGLRAADVPHWVAGGWGVDALVGRQTREHRDLDLLVDAAAWQVALAVTAGLGYISETEDLPIRLEVAAERVGWVDLHPVVFDERGNGVQGSPDGLHFTYAPDVFVTGSLDGRPVPCLSAARQVEGHSDYPPRAVDEHDLALLRTLEAT